VERTGLRSASCAESQRAAWAAALCDGLHVVDASERDARSALARMLSPERDAIVCLDDFDDALADVLRGHAEAGVRVLLSLSEIGAEEALPRFRHVGRGSLVYQYVAEGALLADDVIAHAQEPTAALEFTERAEPDAAAAFLYAINVPEDVASAAVRLPRVRAQAAPVDTRRLRVLEQANAELWTTNRELGRQLAELRVQLRGGMPPLTAARIGAAPAGSALARIAREQDAERARVEQTEHELRLRIEQLEWKLGERVRQLDAEIQRVGAERDANAVERDNAIRELQGLRGRRAARVVLRLADLRSDLTRR
jgi:hypothetical protein